MPRSHGVQYDAVQKAARFLPKLASSARLQDFQKHKAALQTLHGVTAAGMQEPAVVRSLLLHSQLPQQLCRCLRVVLQQLASSTVASIAANESSLAAVAQLAGTAALLSEAAAAGLCKQILVAAAIDSGERQCCRC
jgi:hypothetical protein